MKTKIDFNPFKNIQISTNETIEIKDDSFIHKYKPKTLNKILGNKEQIQRIIQNIKHKKTCILTGPHGCGKSLIANIILTNLKYDIYEFNYSSNKTRKEIFHYITNSSLNDKLSFKKKNGFAFIIDEFQHTLSLQSGVKHFLKFMETENLPPIICISADKNYYQKDIYKIYENIIFESPSINEIDKFIKSICKKEKLKIDKNTFKYLIKNSDGDIRKLLNTLDILNKSSVNTIDNSYYDKDLTLIESIEKLFKQDYTNINNTLDYFYTDIGMTSLYVHENYIDYTDIDKISQTADSISSGDITQNYLYSNQIWDLWDFTGILNCTIPSYNAFISKSSTNKDFRYSSALNKNSLAINNYNRVFKCFRDSLYSRFLNNTQSLFFFKIIIQFFIINFDIDKLIILCNSYELTYEQFEIIYRNININKKTYKNLTLKNKNFIKNKFNEKS